ncbi:Protein of unknown function [Paenibacillus tianmuensis]|uniref:Lipase (Class 3) n=1 Tax=Paenibacillus tianmuensis TaxID=624147 RepID=A0A1G4SQN5_9BACL|nr:Mbeg1-like protein [Paenibacillus tianmuensis]SCW70875.1 Protein of unknown function [Paenibacillus tianmuensis]
MTTTITEVDKQVLSELIYLNIAKNEELFKHLKNGTLTVGELARTYKNDLESSFKDVEGQFKTKEQFEEFKRSIESLSQEPSKYYNWKISHIDDDNAETGFVAYTFEPEPGQAVFAFRGSEDITKKEFRNDWKNNTSTSYEEESVQQHKARLYMESQAKLYNNITITGHSLGGNLALYATLTAPGETQEKIANCSTFNAPGFNKEFTVTYQHSIRHMREKIQEFQNRYDAVSSLFYNPTKPIMIETSAKKGTLPDLLNMDHHALKHLVNDNGTLIRDNVQSKDFEYRMLSNLTQGIQMLPNPMLYETTELIFAVWNGDIDPVPLMKTAGILAATNIPQTMVTVGAILKAVEITFVAAAFVTAAQIAAEVVDDKIAQFKTWVIRKFDDLFEQAGLGAILKERFHDFKQRVYAEVHDIVSRVSKFVKDSWYTWKQSGIQHEDIRVNMMELRNLASRLQAVQNQIVHVDRRLDTLASLVDWQTRISVTWIDFKVGYNQDLRRCIDYLHRTVDELEQCERTITQKAYAF